jgi:hypothetical protein
MDSLSKLMGNSVDQIPEEMVEQIWREVSSFAPARAHKEMIKAGKDQPDLLDFMMEFTQDVDEQVKELAIYMFFVVYRMFQKNSTKKLRRIAAEEIIAGYESNEKLLERLEGAHERFFERIARVQVSQQPYVMKYVVETLIEAPEEEDPVELTEEDVGYLFLLLKTVVDLLDKAA